MFKHQRKYLQLFLATLLTIGLIHNSDRLIPTKTLAQHSVQTSVARSELVAKKSGGRSGGGSFKSRTRSSGSRNRRSSGSRNRGSSGSSRNSNNNSSPRSNYNRNYESSPTYNSGNTRSYSNGRPTRQRLIRFIILTILFLTFGVLIFIPLFILFKSLGKFYSKDSRVARRTQQEIDNDKVTVSQIQLALSDRASNIQQDLSELSLNSNTATSEGLLELMREASLIVLRNSEAWTHVLSSSVSMNFEEAESAFEALSLAERSKYRSETLSNVDGKIKTKQPATEDSDVTASYLVVTLLFGTVDDKPLFDKINTEQSLAATLQQLATMREDYLIKFELLWSPQTEGVYLTDEELLIEYTKMIPLI